MNRDQKPARFKALDFTVSRTSAPVPAVADQSLVDGAATAESSIAGGLPVEILIAIFLIFCMIGGVGTTLLPQLMP